MAIQVFVADGFLSVGWLVLLIWVPYGGLIFFAGWNSIHPVWRYVKTPRKASLGRRRVVPVQLADGTPGTKIAWSPSPVGGGTTYDYERVQWTWPERRRAIGWLSFMQLLFLGSFAYRYFESVFFMAILHGGVFILVLSKIGRAHV